MGVRWFLVFVVITGSLLLPSATRAQTVIRTFELARSTEGRVIEAVQIGTGPRKLVLIGDTHGAPEANTYQLMLQLIEHFKTNPDEVPASVRLYLIPTINPDGLELNTRFNARGVDLNRNMNTNLDACPENDWRVTVFGAGGVLSPTGGPYADSEVESRIVRWFLLDASAVIFYHSNAGLVFPAACEHGPSIALAQAYATGSNYQYARFWDRYAITGGMHDWARGLEIAAIIPELITGDLPEFEQNLAGVRTVLQQAEQLVPELPASVTVDGMVMPMPIWRFWKMHGGVARFGSALTSATTFPDGVIRQYFERGLLEWRTDRADTPEYITVAPLGREVVAALPANAPAAGSGEGQIYPETGKRLEATFAGFWQRAEGLALYGYPLSDPYLGRAADGQLRLMQVFERGVLSYNATDDTITAEPVGWYRLAQVRLAIHPHSHTIR